MSMASKTERPNFDGEEKYVSLGKGVRGVPPATIFLQTTSFQAWLSDITSHYATAYLMLVVKATNVCLMQSQADINFIMIGKR